MWQLETQLFAPPLFNWRTFLRQVAARWSCRGAKNQVSTNQNSKNRWYQILRGTICKLISSNRKFWKTSKLLSSKGGLNSKLMPIEKYKLVSEEPESDRILNKNFTNITKNVKLKRSPYLCHLNETYCFQNHTSIFKIASIGNP